MGIKLFGLAILCLSISVYGFHIILDPEIESLFLLNYNKLSQKYPSLKAPNHCAHSLRKILGGMHILSSVFLLFRNKLFFSLICLGIIISSIFICNPMFCSNQKEIFEASMQLFKNLSLIGGLIIAINLNSNSIKKKDTKIN